MYLWNSLFRQKSEFNQTKRVHKKTCQIIAGYIAALNGKIYRENAIEYKQIINTIKIQNEIQVGFKEKVRENVGV